MTIKRTTGGRLLRSAAGHLCLSCCDGVDCATACNGKCYRQTWGTATISGCTCDAAIIEWFANSTGPNTFTHDCAVAYPDQSSNFGQICGSPPDLSFILPIFYGANECPPLGTTAFVLTVVESLDPTVIVCTGTIDITFAEVACCTEISGPNYYLSCDMVYTEHTDIDGDITDCDGTGGGGNTVEVCNGTNTITDELLTWSYACFWSTATAFPCHFYNGNNGITLQNLNGDWLLAFGDGVAQETTRIGGPTPVGTYPDCVVCFNNGFAAFSLSITNIVITA